MEKVEKKVTEEQLAKIKENQIKAQARECWTIENQIKSLKPNRIYSTQEFLGMSLQNPLPMSSTQPCRIMLASSSPWMDHISYGSF